MRKILVPTDLSPTAERGIDLAIEIAQRNNAEIFLVNFTSHPFGRTFSAMGEVDYQNSNEEVRFHLDLIHKNDIKLRDLGKHYADHFNLTIHTELIDEDLIDGIHAFIEENEIDLVVMGTSGVESGLEKFIGNRTEQIISSVSCPVISIRDRFEVDRFKDIVLALDIILNSRMEPGLKLIKELADQFGSRIHLVHADRTTSRMERDIQHYLKQVARINKFTNYTISVLNNKDEAKGVSDYARSINAGMVAVLKNSKSSVMRIFSDHFSDRMVKEIGRPVFTYNLQNV